TGTGRLTLMGDFAMTGRLDVSAGTLAFAGTSLGNARVQGGTLIGSGTFGGSLTMTSGTLSPGGLIGTNNVVQPLGMFRADSLAISGGNLLFDIGGQNLGNLSDVIRVTGPAVLTGGTVNVNALSATNQYAFQQNYTIVQTGTLSGTFANGTTFANVANNTDLKWRLRYDLAPNSVVLQVQKNLDFAAAVAGGSPNQLAIGNALNGSAGMASDQWAATLNALSAVPAAQRGATYNSLSGEAISDIGTSTFVANSLFMDLMRDRIGDSDDTLTGSGFASANLSGVRSVSTQQRGLANALAARGDGISGGAVWAQAYGSLQRLTGHTGQATLETTVAGAAMGAEGRIGDLVVGVAGGYTGVTADVNARNSTVDGRLVQAGGYASYDSGTAFVSLAGNYYTGKFDSVRTINVGGALSTALGDLKSHGYAVSASAGYRADLGGGLRMVAVASATKTHDTRDAFTERAPGGLGLASARAKRDLFTATGEVRLGQWIKTGSGYAMPYVSAGVRYNAGDLDTIGNMRFSGAPAGLGAFQVQGARISPLVGTWGAGVDVKASERVSLGVAVENAYSNHTREGRASMRVKIGF
ncbi:MAG: autotransporter outer membrane beta-barrel domain-containing protein, partial [Sphingomonadales bacterium]